MSKKVELTFPDDDDLTYTLKVLGKKSDPVRYCELTLVTGATAITTLVHEDDLQELAHWILSNTKKGQIPF